MFKELKLHFGKCSETMEALLAVLLVYIFVLERDKLPGTEENVFKRSENKLF